MKSTQMKYGRISQIFHWLSTLILVLMWSLGLYMTRIAEGDGQALLYRMHVVLGLLLLVLTVARIIWRFFEPTPDMPAKLSLVQKRTIKIFRLLTYFFILLLTFSGVGILLTNGMGLSMSSIVPAEINGGQPASLHVFAYRILIVLLIMHIGGIVRYQMVYGDALGRMGIHLSRN